MSNATNQTQLMNDKLMTQNMSVTEKLRLPGIETLHERSAADIGSALANVIKSRSGIISLNFVVGSHIEITYNGNPHTQLR
jgi:hypothetical protein